MTWQPPTDAKPVSDWKPPADAKPAGGGRWDGITEGVTPENPMETTTNLMQAAGGALKGPGTGKAGLLGVGLEETGKQLDDMTPKTPGQVAGMEIAGAITEKAGGAVYNKLVAVAPEVRAATDKAVQTAKSMGFKLMPSQETQSYLAGLFENVMRKLPGGAAVFQKYEQMQNAGYVAAKTRIIDSLGKETEMGFGGSLKEALGKSNDQLTARADALLKKGQVSKDAYDKALTLHEQKLAGLASDALKGKRADMSMAIGGQATAEGRGLAVQLEAAHQSSLDYLHKEALWSKATSGVPKELDSSAAPTLVAASEKLAKRLESAGIRNEVYAAAKRNLTAQEDEKVAGIMKEVAERTGLVDAPVGAGEGPTKYSLQALKDKQSFYGSLADGMRNPDGSMNQFGSMFREMQKAAQADMDGIFAHPGVPAEVKQNWQIAKAFTKEKMGMADLKVVRSLWNENPSAVLDAVVKGGDRKGTQTLIQALGGSETGRLQIKRHIFDQVFGAGDAPIPKPDRVLAGLSEYSDNIAVIFSKDEQKQLYSLGRAAEAPKILQDQYNRRVKDILDRFKQQAVLERDPVLRKLARQEPQQLVHSVMSGDTGVVRAVKKYVSPEQFQAYQRYGMRDLLADPALPQRGAMAIKDELAKKPEFYKELLGEKNWAEMQHIGDAELLLPGYKDLKAPSKMQAAGAQLGMAATFGVMGLMLHPFQSRTLGAVAGIGVGLTIGPQVLSELYLSDGGRRLVTTILRLPQTDPRAEYLIGRLAAAGYVSTMNAQQQPPKQGNAPR